MNDRELDQIEKRFAAGQMRPEEFAALLAEVRRLREALERSNESLRLREAIIAVWKRTVHEHEDTSSLVSGKRSIPF